MSKEARTKYPREYSSWSAMIDRCTPSPAGKRKQYVERGITVCRRWRKSFYAFLQDMGAKPTSKHSIDRINNSRGYFPKNCRWATPKQQRENQRPYDESARVRAAWKTRERKPTRVNILGNTFGKLTVLGSAETRNGRAYWKCRCACGKEKEISGKTLRSGAARSCGCGRYDGLRKAAAFRTSEEQRARAIKRWYPTTP